ncbi:MAG: hypothetical protein PHF57_13805, partial [Methanoregula sp.]|nr:hypothetical protein [Methanoregula sp.]
GLLLAGAGGRAGRNPNFRSEVEVTPHFSTHPKIVICACLIAAVCIAGCTNQQVPDIPGIQLPSSLETTPATPQ